jgi:predicted Ser/Thr protein kinase
MTQDPFINKRLGGCRILEKLGEGGMGFAYKAHHDRLDRTVVLKILRPELARDKNFLEGFLREAQAAAKLEHPRIVQVYDQGSEGGWHYIVMQFIEGETLEDRLKAKGKMAPLEAVPIVKAVLEGLKEAHSRGIVHRDIKPSNILMSGDGAIRIADFGLAAPAGGGEGSAAIQGTPDYMPPEQAWGGTIDARSDLYALGGTLYHMLAGEAPYGGHTAADVISQHREAPVPDVRAAAPDVSRQAAEIVMRLMAKEPKDRYADADAVIQELNSPGVVLGEATIAGEMEIDLGEAVTQPIRRRIREPTPMPRTQAQAPPRPARPARPAEGPPVWKLGAASGLALGAGALAFIGGHSANLIAAGGAALCAAGAWWFAPHQAGIAAMALVAVGVGVLHGAGLLTQETAAGELTVAAGAGAAPWLAAALLSGWGAFTLALDDKKTAGDRLLLVVLLAMSMLSWHWFGLPGGSPLGTLFIAELRWPGAAVLLGLALGLAFLARVVSGGIAESLSDILFPLFLILAAGIFAYFSGALHHTPAADPPTVGVVLARPFELLWTRLGRGDGLAATGLLILFAGLGPMWYRVLVRPLR